ncbi:MAG: hypothetical protein ABFC96_17550 [Thermoguttaceae bacterium]
MPLFSKRKNAGVTSFVLKLVNNNCPGLKALADGPRVDSRVTLVVPVIVAPLADQRIELRRAFTAVTKEFSNSGVAIVLDGPVAVDEAVLGFRFEGAMTFLRAKARHVDPIGGGFFQLGLQLTEVVFAVDYPELESLIL